MTEMNDRKKNTRWMRMICHLVHVSIRNVSFSYACNYVSQSIFSSLCTCSFRISHFAFSSQTPPRHVLSVIVVIFFFIFKKKNTIFFLVDQHFWVFFIFFIIWGCWVVCRGQSVVSCLVVYILPPISARQPRVVAGAVSARCF